MKVVFLLLSLLGLGAAYKVGHEYRYDYYSQIAMGIPEIREQIAATGIRAQVHIQFNSKVSAIVKLSNVKVGEFHGQSKCGMTGEVPISYSSVSGDAKLLEEPFEVNFHLDKGNVMVVTKSEVEWIVNIKKAIAHVFILKPLTSPAEETSTNVLNVLDDHSRSVHYSTELEETFFGRCESDYTLTTVVPFPSTEMPAEPMKKENQYFHLVKNINFDKCSHPVVVQHNGVANATKAGHSNFGAALSRSSVSKYNITGNVNDYVITQGQSHGAFVMNPFGFKTDKIQSYANQTIVLTSVNENPSPMKVSRPYKIVNSWQMEMASPFRAGFNSPVWMNYYHHHGQYPPVLSEYVSTGIALTDSQMQRFQTQIERYITNAAKILRQYPSTVPNKNKKLSPFDTPESTSLFYLDSAARIVNAVPHQFLMTLFDKFNRDNSEEGQIKTGLFVDVCAADGGGGPLDMVLEKLRKHEISATRGASVFMTLTNNIVSPEVLPKLASFARNLSLEHDFYFTSTVWINLASTIHRLCLNPKTWKYAIPYQVYGDSNCAPAEGMEMLLPFLQQRLDRTNRTEDRMVIVQAISNLGTGSSLSTLKKVVMGQYHDEPVVRTIAAYGLAYRKMNDVPKHQILKILKPIVANSEEVTEVRQVAFTVMLTWHPSTSWWEEMATLSWNEPSHMMGAYIYTTIYSYSRKSDPFLMDQIRAASLALKMARPYPLTQKLSFNRAFSTYVYPDQLRTLLDMAVITSSSSGFPREVFTYLTTSLGGFRMDIFEVSFNTNGIDSIVSKYLSSLPGESTGEPRKRHPRDTSSISSNIISLMTEQLGFSPIKETTFEGSMYVRMMQHVQHFAVYKKEAVQKLTGDIEQLLKKLSSGYKLLQHKYINPVTAEMIIPTQIGLPMLTRISNPVVVSNIGTLNMFVDGGASKSQLIDILRAKELEVHASVNVKYVKKTISAIRVILPWNQKLISTGVEYLNNVNLPGKAGVKLVQQQNSFNVSTFFESVYQKQFPLVNQHNIPFTVVKGMYPGGDINQLNVEPITLRKDGKLATETIIPYNTSYTGVHGESVWRGDVFYPFTRGYFMHYMSNPAELVKFIVSPTARGYQAYHTVNFGQSNTKRVNMSFSHETLVNPASGSVGSGFTRTNLLLSGSQTRYYQVDFKHSKNIETDAKKIRYLKEINYHRSPLPGFDNEPHSYCLKSTVISPQIHDPKSFKELLSGGHVVTTMTGELDGGRTCKDKVLAEMTGTLKMSTRRINELKKEVNNDCHIVGACPILELQTDPVYDTWDMTIKYKNNEMPTDVRNTTYHLYDMMRGVRFPFIEYNYLVENNQRNVIQFNGQRPLGLTGWDIRVELPTENIHMYRAPIPYVWERVLPYTDNVLFPMLRESPTMIGLSSTFVCRVSPKEVRTFDQVVYKYVPRKCWTVASVNMQRPEEIVVLTREGPSGPEVKVLLPKEETTIYATKSMIQVNQQPLSVSSERKPIFSKGRFVASVKKLSSQIEIEVPYKVKVLIDASSMEVMPSMIYQRGVQGGICGDFSGHAKYQLRGPRHAYFNNTELFAKAWTFTEGEGCAREQIQSQRQRIEKYERQYNKLSPRSPTVKLERTPSGVPNDGIVFVYPIKRMDSYVICVAQTSVAMCLPGWHLTQKQTYREVYNCWPPKIAPEVVLKSEKRGYVRQSVNVLPEVTTSFSTDHAYLCDRN